MCGCTQPRWSVLPAPIPMQLAGGSGALLAAATVDAIADKTPFSVLVDTATILTTYDDRSHQTKAHFGGFTMFGIQPGGAVVPRFTIENVQLFETPLATVGIGAAATPIGGVIGGDSLSRFAVGLDYRQSAPSLTLLQDLRPCSCELSGQCQAVINFTLAGGQDTQLQGPTFVAIGNNLFTYPPSRVLVDACLEPLPDPLTATGDYLRCAGGDTTRCPAPQYMPSGADVKLVVATGFPGVGLSASAFDRLRGQGAAAELLGGATVALHLGDSADEGGSRAGVAAAQTTLGRAPLPPATPGASALALVGREGYFGPCAELARSRRLRRYIATGPSESACLVDYPRRCTSTGAPPLLVESYSEQCHANSNNDTCSDSNNGNTPAAPVVELTKPLPIYVLPDVTPLLVSLNADVRPSQASVDGVIGTEALARLVMTVDYPHTRLVARCADKSDCLAYAELTPKGNCDFCIGVLSASAPAFVAPCAAAP